MTIENSIDSIGASVSLSRPAQIRKESVTSFADILNARANTANNTSGTSFRRFDPIAARQANAVDERPSCLICGMTISSEGTCLCAYPTVIFNFGKVELKHNPSAEAKGADISESRIKLRQSQRIDVSQISENNKAFRELQKIKLRRRCLTCGAPVSDDGSCMCDSLNDNKISAPQGIKNPETALPTVPFSGVSG